MIHLRCPACGGALELPENLPIAHCIYCGAKILLDEYQQDDSKRVENYGVLAETALGAKNYQEVLDFCNRILAIDPKNVDAWVKKATACVWLSTPETMRFEEALRYMETAQKIAPENEGIGKAKEELIDTAAEQLVEWGTEQFSQTHKTYYQMRFKQSKEKGLSKILDQMAITSEAKAANTKGFSKAMTLFVEAANLRSGNMQALLGIQKCKETADWITWPQEMDIEYKLHVLNALQMKEAARKRLRELEGTLNKLEQKLQGVQEKGKSTNLFSKLAGNTEENIQREMQVVREEMEKQKGLAGYEPLEYGKR